MTPRIRALFRHYSSWALWAITAVGGLWQYVPEVREFLPLWVVQVLAVAGLIGKLIPQGPKPGELSAQTYADYRRNLPR